MTLKPEHIVEALNKKTFDEIDGRSLKHYATSRKKFVATASGSVYGARKKRFRSWGTSGHS